MDKQKAAVILLVIAIVMSAISVVISISSFSQLEPMGGSTNKITNYFYTTGASQSSGGGEIGITILPPEGP